MIKIFVDNTELDLYGDESIELNKSIKRLTDIEKIYSPFTESFTVPASRTNNAVFKHYYRDDLDQNRSGLSRIPATITLAGNIFEQGSIAIEGAQIKNGLPVSYEITFYGSVASFSELAGGDTLNVLDLSDFNHEYNATNVQNGLDGTGLSSGSIIYPLFSPVRYWKYNSDANHDSNNIAYHSGHGGGNPHGVFYYELKPAILVSDVFDAIADYYGLTFTGSFLSSNPFAQLYLWLHNREGYVYEGQEGPFEPLSNREIIRGLTTITNTANAPIQGIPTSQQAIFVTSNTLIQGGYSQYTFVVNFSTLSNDCYLYLTRNGVIVDIKLATTTGVNYTLFGSSFPVIAPNATYRVFIGKVTASLTYNLTLDANWLATDGTTTTSGTGASCSMSSSITLTEDVVISNLLPNIQVTDFINGIVRMYNLIITSEDGVTYNFETRDSYYGAGTDVSLDRWIDSQEIEVSPVPKYRALNFKYAESDQVLQKQFRDQVGRGYGDLVQSFNFDSPNVLNISVPFDHLFTGKLTDDATGSFVDFTVYQSIELDEDNKASSYYGSPVLFYKNGTIDISGNSIGLLDETNTETEITTLFFCEDVNSTTASSARSTTYSQEINPYLEQEPNSNLYEDYWSDQISNTYDTRVRVYKLKANLNLGVLLDLSLNDTILWKGRKYLINDFKVNLRTMETTLTIITKV